MKRCSKCGKDQPLGDFPKNPSSRDGLRSRCKRCHSDDQMQRYHASGGKDRVREYARANPDKVREWNARHYVKNGEAIRRRAARWYAANRDRARQNHLAWQERNPDRKKEIDATRRARKLANGVVPYRRSDIFERDGWVCQLCFQPIDRGAAGPRSASASIDHIVPISKGGADAPDNVQAAHFGCNSRKKDRLVLTVSQ